MNILSLFDGMSGGQIAFDKLGIKFDGKEHKYFASEIKKNGIKVTKHNYPNTIHIGDVTKVSYKDGVLYTENGEFKTKIDMVIGGSPCFTAGTLVLTDKGYKNIEDIVAGDMVLTHTNSFKKVVVPMRKIADHVYRLKAPCTEDLLVTGEHPFYVKRKKGYSSYTKPKWIPAKDLLNTDLIGIAINKNNKLPVFEGLNDKFSYIYFWTYVGMCVRSFNPSDQFATIKFNEDMPDVDLYIEEVYEEVSECLDCYIDNYKIIIRDENFNKYIKTFVDEKGNKVIKQEIIDMPREHLLSFLNGFFEYKEESELFNDLINDCYDDEYDNMFDDDFWENEDKEYEEWKRKLYESEGYKLECSISFDDIDYDYDYDKSYIVSNNKKLVYSLGHCIAKAYNKQFFIECRENTYYLEVLDNATYKHNIIWLPISSINKEEYNGTVYNMEVEKDHSYTVNNIIVHNCQDFSLLKTSKKYKYGLEGDKSRLFYEYLRLLKEINPKYFLLENVKMKKDSEQQLNQYLGVEGIHINSKLVSFQNRPRIYWTNIPNVTIPEDRNISFQDFKETDPEICKKYKLNPTPSRIKMWNNGKGNTGLGTCANVTHSDKVYCLTRKQDRAPNSGLIEFEDFARYLTRKELELAQTIPVGYTDILPYGAVQDLCGDGWTIDVISHILSHADFKEFGINIKQVI